MTCHWCGERLIWSARGWVHAEGGHYKVRCNRCGWTGAPYPSPTRCPACGAADVYDLHCALPVPDASDYDPWERHATHRLAAGQMRTKVT